MLIPALFTELLTAHPIGWCIGAIAAFSTWLNIDELRALIHWQRSLSNASRDLTSYV